MKGMGLSQIAFDLDGVFIPDCDQFPNIGGLDEFYALTSYMRPIFCPVVDYNIITARPARYRAVTHSWCEKYLTIKPIRLYHELTTETPEEYKAHVLNNNTDIHMYVESDPKIVSYLRDNVKTKCLIVHFSEYLERKLNLRDS